MQLIDVLSQTVMKWPYTLIHNNSDLPSFSLLSPSMHRYPHLCSAVGIHSTSPQEAQVPLHGQLGEQEGGAISFP